MRQGWITDDYGNRKHFVDDKLHSINDEPALIYLDGAFYWYKNNFRHRDNGLPAITRRSGYKAWLENDQFHRADGLPALIYPRGEKCFYENGKWLDPCKCGNFAEGYCPSEKRE